MKEFFLGHFKVRVAQNSEIWTGEISVLLNKTEVHPTYIFQRWEAPWEIIVFFDQILKGILFSLEKWLIYWFQNKG